MSMTVLRKHVNILNGFNKVKQQTEDTSEGNMKTFKIREDTMDRIISCQCNVCEFMQSYGIGSSKEMKVIQLREQRQK